MVLALAAGAMGACGIRQGAADRTTTPDKPADRASEASDSPPDPAACAAAQQRTQVAVKAAASGCKTDEDCDLFQTCHPVTRPSTPRLWKLHDEAKALCRGLPDSVLSCPPTPARCQDGTCTR